MSNPATGRDRYTIGKTSVGLDEGEQSLIGLGERQAQSFAGQYSHAHAKHLAWAEMLVEIGGQI
jgi:hypothetical protein